MRKSWIIWGIVWAALGLLITIGGAVAEVVSRTSATTDPTAEARTPGTATFDAGDETYEIFIVHSRRDQDSRTAEAVVCDVELANGRNITIDGSKQNVSSEVNNTEKVGSFDAVSGETSVTCEADGIDIRFVIDSESLLDRIGIWIILGGVLLILVGAALILGGVFLKKAPKQPAFG